MIYRRLNIKYLATLALLFCSLLSFAAPNPNNGKSLFRAKCATCHNGNMKADMTGPALGGVQERWEGKEEELYNWIRNSQQVIASGDPYAVKLFNDWNKSVMQAFPELTNENIDDILLYVNNMYSAGCAEPPCQEDFIPTGGVEEESGFNWLYALLFGILALLALALVRITSNLNHLADVKAGGGAARRTLLDILTSKGIVTFVIFVAVVIGGFTTVNNAINFGRQQDYAPVQPIKFSHETHAGINKIDCQYCHDGARRSKHAVIPAVNTCMNCHKAINNGSEYGKTEISKIYAASGFDPVGKKYYDDYANMNKDTLVENMRNWLALEYKKDEKLKEKDYMGKVNEQLDEIAPYIQAPMEWVRIHNLPDHVYFNHAQHVVAGGVECQTCHGAVEEMETMKQYAPLSMGWCINCHRETEVQFANNPYYDTYSKYHDDLKAGTMDKVTVEDIGGLECQKCHY